MNNKIMVLGLFLTSLLGCVSAPTKTPDPLKTQSGLPEEEAICFISGEVFKESNLTREADQGRSTYIMKTKDGKKLGLPMDECILQSQTSSELKVVESLSEKKHTVNCQLGPVSFVSDNLTYVADEPGYYRLRGPNGMEWSLPRFNCKIYGQQSLP